MAGGVQALIFDVDGTLAETEELHRAAFNRAFASAGLDISWDRTRYRELLGTTGGKRRILRHFTEAGLNADEALAAELHRSKNMHYAEAVGRGVELRPGVFELMRRARQAGLRLAIATTTSRSNLAALLTHAPLPEFDAIVAGEDVSTLKPHPEVYLKALAQLDLPAGAALAFEDSANGLRSATAAGLRTIVTPSTYSVGEDFTAAAAVLPDLTGFDWERWV
jgi:HAD superfamily hydrolase (TIGR01509 family)